MAELYNAPIPLDAPRAWRTYLGGAGLDALHGSPSGEDGHFPEEWIMSVVAARNAGREDFPEEGLSHLREHPETSLKELLESDPEHFLGAAHAHDHGAQLGVLVKLIDSAERLTIQVHPDRATAMELFRSPFGKTECWHILGGREINGEKPCIYFGFKEGITREHWKHLFDVQDIPGMLDCLHRFEVQPGDTILIEGGIPHAIGAGCFLTEIQEPTDYTIRVERTTPSSFPVADSMCHQGLGFDTMFDCFHYQGYSREETQRRWFLQSGTREAGNGAVIEDLVRYSDTPFFAMRCLNIPQTLTLQNERFNGLYVLKGAGTLHCGGTTCTLQAPQQIFIPAAVQELHFAAENNEPLQILQCYGPQD